MILLRKKFKKKGTSNRKLQQVFGSIGLDKVGIYQRDGPFSCDIGIVNLHPFRGSHWVVIHKRKILRFLWLFTSSKTKFIIKRNGHCLFSEYKIQGLTNKGDIYCASYCLFIIYLTKVSGVDFISAVLILYYQIIFWILMTLRKITIDNSVKYIPQSEHTSERDSKPNTKKNRKQIKSISQNGKTFLKDTIRREGFRILRWKMNCYF